MPSDSVCLSFHLCLCSITGFSDHCTTFVLLAAYGAGAAELEKIPVMRGPQWSAAQTLEQPEALHFSIRSMDQLASLPPDFLVLHNAGNLCSFMSVTIATDSEVVGILTIGKEDPDGFDIDRCVVEARIYASSRPHSSCKLRGGDDAIS